MPTDYKETDYDWIRELLDYPRILEERLAFEKLSRAVFCAASSLPGNGVACGRGGAARMSASTA